MADSKAQREAADWVRQEFLRSKYGQPFDADNVLLKPGGQHVFSAVSRDRSIVGTISTSEAVTSSGKRGVGKLSKLFADLYFLLLADCSSRILVFSERSMLELFEDQRNRGRIPESIEAVLCDLPDELAERVLDSRRRASAEVGG